MAIKLYYVPRTSAGRPRWMLEEIGEPYELVRLDPKLGQTRTPEHLRLHPLGHVPVLADGDLVIWESAAILQHLADKFPDRHLAPPVGTPARAHYYQWIAFAMAELLPAILRFAQHTSSLPEEKRVAWIAEDARKALQPMFAAVAAALERGPFILGEAFSAADLMVGGGLIFAHRNQLLADQPSLTAYAQRLMARPAWQRATAD